MDEILLVKDYLTPINGLFSHIDYDFEFVEKPVLDLLVFTTFGERRVAPVVSTTLSLKPTEEELTSLGTMVKSLYKNKWDKYKALLKVEYDPIRNYEDTFTETIHGDESNVGTESINSQLPTIKPEPLRIKKILPLIFVLEPLISQVFFPKKTASHSPAALRRKFPIFRIHCLKVRNCQP